MSLRTVGLAALWLVSTALPASALLEVSAGPDLAAPVAPGAPAYEVALDGSVLVDGVPPAPGAVTIAWSRVSGPGGGAAISFADPAAPQTNVSFALSGVYVLQLAADDGVAVVTDQVAVTVDLLAAALTTQNLYPEPGADDVPTPAALEVDCPGEGTPLAAVVAEYVVATDPDFAQIVHTSGWSETDLCGHVALPPLPEATELHWSARRRDATGAWTAWSIPTSFTTLPSASLTTIELQSGLDGYAGAADADIRGSWEDPSTAVHVYNQGAQDVLRLGRRRGGPTEEIFRSLVRFDLTGVVLEPDRLVGAQLELTGWMHGGENLLFSPPTSVYALLWPWGEGTGVVRDVEEGEVSWLHSEYPTPWAVPGASGIGTDREGEPLLRTAPTNVVGAKHYLASEGLTEAVRGWLEDPASNFGLLLKVDNEDRRGILNLASREVPDPTYFPKLVLHFRNAVPACADGIDNDGDGAVDWPADISCPHAEAVTENPECSDGLNNDPSQDNLIDFDGGASAGLPPEFQTDPDPGCGGRPWSNESPAGHCGLGFELAGILPLLAALRRRRPGVPLLRAHPGGGSAGRLAP